MKQHRPNVDVIEEDEVVASFTKIETDIDSGVEDGEVSCELIDYFWMSKTLLHENYIEGLMLVLILPRMYTVNNSDEKNFSSFSV